MKFLDLKVFVNKRNGQPVVSLPKKAFDKIPATVRVVIPKDNMAKPKIQKIDKGRWW